MTQPNKEDARHNINLDLKGSIFFFNIKQRGYGGTNYCMMTLISNGLVFT